MNSTDRDSVVLHISEYPVTGGGYCDVYRSRLGNGTLVAVKQIRPQFDGETQPILNKNMQKTNRILAKLSHPNIVPLLGEVTVRGNMSTVHEWLQYGSVLEYLEHHPVADRYQLNAKICEGVAYLHAHGIIHGDLKGVSYYNIYICPTL
ncbi:tyrosine kinase domain protein [Rhizoctonia solani AG-3 Rhs1AP]|uniref:Tyrosine kinase domain protein n=1 Tax=Rhizoctonia solani AG-3 Rhs1AP TaxID=1086054 RepID=X8J0H5_9AGAM|nr:tyrosine kinase domain protein [Rhizoctonia solani AG-3 Rhs1AP]